MIRDRHSRRSRSRLSSWAAGLPAAGSVVDENPRLHRDGDRRCSHFRRNGGGLRRCRRGRQGRWLSGSPRRTVHALRRTRAARPARPSARRWSGGSFRPPRASSCPKASAMAASRSSSGGASFLSRDSAYEPRTGARLFSFSRRSCKTWERRWRSKGELTNLHS